METTTHVEAVATLGVRPGIMAVGIVCPGWTQVAWVVAAKERVSRLKAVYVVFAKMSYSPLVKVRVLMRGGSETTKHVGIVAILRADVAEVPNVVEAIFEDPF